MIPGICIKIETTKFPELEAESDDWIKEGTYGKALCLYLQTALNNSGYLVPFFSCEDWGWWVQIRGLGLPLGLRIYSQSEDQGNPKAYAIVSSITKERVWSWSRFRVVRAREMVINVMDHVESLLEMDPEIPEVSRQNAIPF